jgi:hypothetical protein
MMKKKPSPRALTAADRRCLEKLRGWIARIDELLELLGDGSHVIGARATQARELFVGFKEGLRLEAKRLATLRRVGELQGFEESDYAPAIEQALADFTVTTNSAPGPAWHRELYNTHITLSDPLSWLEDQE